MSGQHTVQQLIIGGGPAGSMLAICLAAAGRQVVLLEKERSAHHKVCGEFLSREAVGYLEQVGIHPSGLGARPIRNVRMHAGKKRFQEELPFTAMSLSRHVLDEALLATAAAAGCDVRRGIYVEKLQYCRDRWLVTIRGEEPIETNTVFMANGKHDVNGWVRDGKQNDLVGFKMHWRLALAQTEQLRGTMELFLFHQGYGGLSLVENDTANLCLVVRRRRLRELGGWAELLQSFLDEVPGIGERIEGASPCWTKPLAIGSIPYGHLGGRSDGIWRVGDQVAVIPSFTGDGMAIALHSAALAAEMSLAGRTAREYDACIREQLRAGMRLASVLSRAMVTFGGQALAPLALSLLPNTMNSIAASTRVPQHLLLGTVSVPGGQARRRAAPSN